MLKRQMHLALWQDVLIVVLLAALSCSKPLHEKPDEGTSNERSDVKLHKRNSPVDDYVKSDKELARKVEKKEDEGDVDVIFQGDIIISLQDLEELEVDARGLRVDRRRRSAGSDVDPTEPPSSSPKVFNKLWPNCRVPYTFDQFLDPRLRVTYRNAMMMWEKHTCIKFVMKTTVDNDFLVLEKGDICKSHVGRQGGLQRVYIADKCNTTGHAAHELGHAIGLWHEHSRPDRDDYIEYHEDNVLDRRDRVNFQKITPPQFNEMPFVRYDIQSIMHYSAYAFALYAPGKETISVKEDANLPELNCTNTLHMGQRKELSYLDSKRLSFLYDCEFNLEEPTCVLPTPSATTPLETKMPTVTTIPTPTTTKEAMTLPPLDGKLRSGNVIVLKFPAGKNFDGEEQFGGVKCVPSPGCLPSQSPCTNQGGDSCITSESQFQIINHPSISSSPIRSESAVLFRSYDKPAYWLDCSELIRCRMTQCHEDYVEEPANASYISNCSRHHFQIYGTRKSGLRLDKGKKMQTKHRMQLKYSDHGFMDCNNHICRLLQEGTCPSHPLPYFTAPLTETTCDPQTFTITKTLE